MTQLHDTADRNFLQTINFPVNLLTVISYHFQYLPQNDKHLLPYCLLPWPLSCLFYLCIYIHPWSEGRTKATENFYVSCWKYTHKSLRWVHESGTRNKWISVNPEENQSFLLNIIFSAVWRPGPTPPLHFQTARYWIYSESGALSKQSGKIGKIRAKCQYWKSVVSTKRTIWERNRNNHEIMRPFRAIFLMNNSQPDRLFDAWSTTACQPDTFSWVNRNEHRFRKYMTLMNCFIVIS